MIEFLNPCRKLVDEVVDWLCGRVERDPSGARSLAHLMVVVPTAQSGRNLRLVLAKKASGNGWGGILPPRKEGCRRMLDGRRPQIPERRSFRTLMVQ